MDGNERNAAKPNDIVILRQFMNYRHDRPAVCAMCSHFQQSAGVVAGHVCDRPGLIGLPPIPVDALAVCDGFARTPER